MQDPPEQKDSLNSSDFREKDFPNSLFISVSAASNGTLLTAVLFI